jgi:hypothetical protein
VQEGGQNSHEYQANYGIQTIDGIPKPVYRSFQVRTPACVQGLPGASCTHPLHLTCPKCVVCCPLLPPPPPPPPQLLHKLYNDAVLLTTSGTVDAVVTVQAASTGVSVRVMRSNRRTGSRVMRNNRRTGSRVAVPSSCLLWMFGACVCPPPPPPPPPPPDTTN